MSRILDFIFTGTKDVMSLEENPSKLLNQEVSFYIEQPQEGEFRWKSPMLSGCGKTTVGLETKGSKIPG